MPDLNSYLDALPHGEGFRFVDELVAIEPGVSASGRYHVTGDEPFLPGHFPGNPILPGVALAEAIAQLAGVAAQSDPESEPLADLRLTALRNVKILGAALPGQRLDIEVNIAGRMGNLIQADGKVDVDGATMCTAVITLSGSPAA